MQRAWLATGLLVGCVVIVPGGAWAEEAASPVKVKPVTLHLRHTPLKKALEQVFSSGGTKVTLAADVPPLPLNLTLKEVDEDVAFRLVLRQAKKQVPELDFAPTDSGYRVFLAAAVKKEEKANPYPVTALPKVPSRRSPEAFEDQNLELQQPVSGQLGPMEGAAAGTPLGSDLGTDAGFDPGYNSPFQYGYNGYTDPLRYQQDRYNLRRELSQMDLTDSGLVQGSSAYRYLQRDARRGQDQDRFPGAYKSPILGGHMTRSRGALTDEKDKSPRPSYYNHFPQWIMEPRTTYFNGGLRRRNKGDDAFLSDPTQPGGGGYLPGGFYTNRPKDGYRKPISR